MLAAKQHLENWMERIQRRGGEMGDLLSKSGFVSDVECSIQIARWAYQQTVSIGGMGWVMKGKTEPLLDSCLAVFV
jgi:hypothetical protein